MWKEEGPLFPHSVVSPLRNRNFSVNAIVVAKEFGERIQGHKETVGAVLAYSWIF